MFLRLVTLFSLLSTSCFAQIMVVCTQPICGTTYTSFALCKYFGQYQPVTSRKIGTLENRFILCPERYRELLEAQPNVEIPCVEHYFISDLAMKTIVDLGGKVVFIMRDLPMGVISLIINDSVIKQTTEWENRQTLDYSKLIAANRDKISAALEVMFKDVFLGRLDEYKRWRQFKLLYPQNVYFTCFELLQSNPKQYFEQILKPFGYAPRQINFNRFPPPPSIRQRGFTGSSKEILESFFTEEMKEWSRSVVSQEVLDFYGWSW